MLFSFSFRLDKEPIGRNGTKSNFVLPKIATLTQISGMVLILPLISAKLDAGPTPIGLRVVSWAACEWGCFRSGRSVKFAY